MDYMDNLIQVPLTKHQRDAGVSVHLRRIGAPPEPKARRCADCDCLLMSKSPTATRCTTCHWDDKRKVRRMIGYKALITILALVLSVMITPRAWGQGGNIGSNSSPIVNRQGIPLPGASVAVCQPVTTTSALVTGNLAVLTLLSNPVTAGFAFGQELLISGFSGADTYLNAGSIVNGQIVGGVQVLSVSATTVTFAIAHANATAGSNGSVLQEGNAIQSCAGLSSVYSNPGLTTPVTQPFPADQLGNWNVFAAPGTYYVQFYGRSITPSIRIIVVGGSGSSTNLLPLNNVWTGTNTFPSINSIIWVDGTVYANTGAGLIAAIAASVASGSREVHFCGTINVSTTIQLVGGTALIGCGSGRNLVSTSPTALLQWTGSAGQDIIDVCGSYPCGGSTTRDDGVLIENMILDGGGTARYDIMFAENDTSALYNVKVRNAATAAYYAVDATGITTTNFFCGVETSYCMVLDWGTGGSVHTNTGLENDAITTATKPLLLIQGGSNSIIFNGLQTNDDAGVTTFVGHVEILGLSGNSSFAGGVAGGIGSPNEVTFNGFFPYNAGGSIPTQGHNSDVWLTGPSSSYEPTNFHCNNCTFAGGGVSKQGLEVTYGNTVQVLGSSFSGYTVADIYNDTNAVYTSEIFTSSTDPLSFTGAAASYGMNVRQANNGVLSVTMGLSVLGGFSPQMTITGLLNDAQLEFLSATAGATTPIKTVRNCNTGNDLCVYNNAGTKTHTFSDAGSFTILGGYTGGERSVTGATALTANDYILQADATSGGYTVTLPHAIVGENWTITRKDNTGNTILIAADSGNVNGAASFTLTGYSTVVGHCDLTNCWVTANSGGGSGANQALSNLTSSTAVNQSLIPGAVNSVGLGTSALPWQDLYIGVIANQAADFSTASLTANHTYTFPNVSGILQVQSNPILCSMMPTFTGDVTNTLCAMKVVQLQGVPISSATPIAGQIITDVAGTWTPTAPLQTQDPQTGTSFTIPNTDGGVIVNNTNAGTITDTVPDVSSGAGFPVGFYFEILDGNASGGASVIVDNVSASTFTVCTTGCLVAQTTFTLAPGVHAYIFAASTSVWFVLEASAGSGGGSVFPVTVSGTVNSGGFPCFTSAVVEASSAAIGAGVLPKGGGPGACFSASSITDNATTVTTTDTGGYVGPVFTPSGTTATFMDYAQGATSAAVAPCTTATSICEQAPTAVTSYLVNKPGVSANGIETNNVAAAVITQGFSGDANHSAVVTIGSGTSVGSTSICSTANCPAGTYVVNVYVDLTTACGTNGTYVVDLIYTDDQGLKTVVADISGTGSVPATGVLTTTSTANFGQVSQVIRSTGATSINYSTTAVACGSAGPMVGKLYLSVVPVQ